MFIISIEQDIPWSKRRVYEACYKSVFSFVECFFSTPDEVSISVQGALKGYNMPKLSFCFSQVSYSE